MNEKSNSPTRRRYTVAEQGAAYHGYLSRGLSPEEAALATCQEAGLSTDPKAVRGHRRKWELRVGLPTSRENGGFTKLMQKESPDFYEAVVKKLGGPETSAKRIAETIKGTQQATVVHQGEDTGLPDWKVRAGGARLEMQYHKDVTQIGFGVEQVRLSTERNELERKKVAVMKRAVSQSGPLIQIVLDTGQGEQIFDADARVVKGKAAAVPSLAETGGVSLEEPVQAVGDSSGAGNGEE